MILPNVPIVKDLHIRILRNYCLSSIKLMRVYFYYKIFIQNNYTIDLASSHLFQWTTDMDVSFF